MKVNQQGMWTHCNCSVEHRTKAEAENCPLGITPLWLTQHQMDLLMTGTSLNPYQNSKNFDEGLKMVFDCIGKALKTLESIVDFHVGAPENETK